MITFPAHRDQLGQWLNEHGLTGAMAEIGVAHGGFARIVLNDWKGKAYYMVDPWTAQPTDIYKERQEEPWKYEHWFKECTEMAASDRRIHVLRGFSTEVSKQFEPQSLDCVFIDGNHDWGPVIADMMAWYPKVKLGGLFCGHDYYDSETGGNFCFVKRAVDLWMKNRGLEFVANPEPCTSWWHIKPTESRYIPSEEETERMAQ